MSLRRRECYSTWRAATFSRGVRALTAGTRRLPTRYFVTAVAFAVATSLTLLLQAPPSHAFYILWGSATLIGASHGSLGQGLAAGLLSSLFVNTFFAGHLCLTPADPYSFPQSFAFLAFALLVGRLNTVRAREAKARRSQPKDC